MSAYESAAPAPQSGSTDPSRPDDSAGSRTDEVRLSLSGATPDGDLLLTDGDGGVFRLPVDARLRAAVAPPAPPRRETPVESVLRPRDIQARIRAGESVDQVAAAAQTTVEKVMPFAGPVLAEREHIAGRAQKSSLRRPTGQDGAPLARTLGEAVEGRIRALHLDPTDLVTWDAWRRDDGRWTLTGRFELEARTGTAAFTFDAPGNFVVLDNDDARWLVGDLADEPEPVVEAPTGPRRLSAVRDHVRDHDEQQLSIDDELGLDAVDLVSDSPVEAFLEDRPGLDERELVEEAADAAASDPDPDPDLDPEPSPTPPRRPVRKTRGRASVPSWDEIMFGPGE